MYLALPVLDLRSRDLKIVLIGSNGLVASRTISSATTL